MRQVTVLVPVFGLLTLITVGLSVASTPIPARARTSSTNATGTIVYDKNSLELRLMEADGSNDRLLYKIPDGTYPYGGIKNVAWRPDGKQIAFTSGHEGTCSRWQSDIYLINSDGTGLKRLSNAPKCADYASLPTGSVKLKITNHYAGESQWFIYMPGKQNADAVTVQPNTTVEVTINNVGDLGSGILQQPVVINGSSRWLDAAAYADVLPGQTVSAGEIVLDQAYRGDEYGATRISWKPDSTTIGFIFGSGLLRRIGINADILEIGTPLLASNVSVGASHLAWSPTSDDILYAQHVPERGIYRAQVGGDAGTKLVNVTLTYGIAWLPDTSGFIYADTNNLLSESNLYRYAFGDSSITPLTQFSGEYAAAPAVSLDGSKVTFGHASSDTAPLNLRIMNSDGSGMDELSLATAYSSWGQPSAPDPVATPVPPTPTPQPGIIRDKFAYLPLTIRK